jgi:methionyl-tRNA formyltransferase
MGSPEFAVPSLEKIHNSPHNIKVVVSNPDKRRGRRGKPQHTKVKEKALELGLPVLDVDDLHSQNFHDQIAALKPDLLIVVAFRILPSSILEIPNIGSINLHASLLPKYRGAAPIHWAVINGEQETGCTIFFLDEKVDTGEIIGQKKIEIGTMDTTGDVYNKLMVMGADLLLESVNKIAENCVEPVAQNHGLATSAPKLFKENTQIDFHRSAQDVHNLVRGLNPFPVAWCTYNGEKMNIYSTKPVKDKQIAPGKLIFEEGKLFAGCGSGAVEINELQLPGTKVMSGKEFANGYEVNRILNESSS